MNSSILEKNHKTGGFYTYNYAEPEDAGFARDTLVRLVCGGNKRIDELKRGDKVVTANGRIATFTEIIVEEEEILFVLNTESGCIKLAGGHPIMLEDGSVVKAADIKPGDILKTPDGGSIVIEVSQEEYDDLAYSPVFEESSSEDLYILTIGV